MEGSLAVLGLELAVVAWGTRSMMRIIIGASPWLPLAYPFLFPGTVLHELAHAVMAAAFRLGPTEVHLFKPSKRPDGSVILGWVEHRVGSPIAEALIALAPMVLVPPVMLVMTWWIGGGTGGFAVRNFFASSATGFVAWLVVVGLGSLGAFPSADDRAPTRGLLALGAVVAVIAVVVAVLGGPRGLAGFVDLTVLWFAAPAVVHGGLAILRLVMLLGAPDDEGDGQTVLPIFIHDEHRRPPRLPPIPRPSWPRPRRRR